LISRRVGSDGSFKRESQFSGLVLSILFHLSREPSGQKSQNVSCWPKADMTARDPDVRFRGQTGRALGQPRLPLLTQSGHAAPFWLIMKQATRLGLCAAHEEAFLDDLTVPNRV
jgi:hypothetical protein